MNERTRFWILLGILVLSIGLLVYAHILSRQVVVGG